MRVLSQRHASPRWLLHNLEQRPGEPEQCPISVGASLGSNTALKLKLVGIGEILWDLLPGGRQLGGAPANFAYHASALGAHGSIVSRIGNDSPGREILT